MSTIGRVTIDLSRVPQFQAALLEGVDRATGRAAIVFEAAAKTGMQTLGGGAAGQVWGTHSQPGQFPATQSGQLRNSITSERSAYANYRVGSNLAQGKWMEFGSNPTAKRGKYLTVPLNYEASRLLKTHGSVRNIAGVGIIARTRRGWLMGFRAGLKRTVRGRASVVRKTKPLFALVPSVRILPRPWCLPTMASVTNQQAALGVFKSTLSGAVRGELAGAKG